MKLKPIDSPALIGLVAGWLSQRENSQWLDFGDGKQVLTPAWLRITMQRDTHLLRVFTTTGDIPIGVIGLSEINRDFRTARIWVVVGEKSFHLRGYATAAVSAMLALAFGDLGLHAVNTWIVAGNPSQRIAERLGFTFVGRQRQCHYIDGVPHDRLWFDLLSSDFAALKDAASVSTSPAWRQTSRRGIDDASQPASRNRRAHSRGTA